MARMIIVKETENPMITICPSCGYKSFVRNHCEFCEYSEVKKR